MRNIFVLVISLLVIIVILPLILIQSCDLSVPEVEEEVVESGQVVKVYNHNTRKIATLDLEEYVKGVISGEMPASFEMEALKAQAVAARSYAISRKRTFGEEGHPGHPGAELCDDVHCQVWLSKEKLEELKSKKWMEDYWPRIEYAVEETRGLIMTYEDKPIDQPLFHSTSGGKTENSEDVFTAWVPYLRSVDSPYEGEAPHFEDEQRISLSTFVSKMKKKYKGIKLKESNVASSIKIVERSDGGRILKMQVANQVVTGRELRELFGLRSANFKVTVEGKDICFDTSGYGHGVGMSQWGANGMAKEGYSFEEILKHYYVGVEVKKMK